MESRDTLEISIVIRCSNDEHIFKCIESIDERVEIIASITKNEMIEKRLNEMGIKYFITPIGNLSITSNEGFKNTRYDKVLITDSDTIFKKGCIEKVFNSLDTYKCVRVNLKPLSSKALKFSYLVAKEISYVFSLPLAFTPGLAVRKTILPEIGGFLFNDSVPFAVDADLNYRINNAGIQVRFLKNAILYHLPASLKHGVKSAFRIGLGVRISAEKLSSLFNKPISQLKRELKAVKPHAIYDIFIRKGASTALYQLIWDFFYYIGYYYQKYIKDF